MPADFDHILLTRFSVRFTHEQPPPDDAWLQYRWAFFRDALASSLSRQTERNFTWLVFCDVNAPEWLREEFAELSPGLFTPVWINQPWSHAVIGPAVSAALTQDQFLITTRLDSDDAVSKRFIEEIQSHFDGQESMYINLLSGVQVARSGKVFAYDEPVNPFISYVERLSPGARAKTVFQSFRHHESSSLAPLLNVVTAPRWMQVIHGSNLANSIRGLRIDPQIVNEEFDLELTYTTQVSRSQLGWERFASRFRLGASRIANPYYAFEAVRARRERKAGTKLYAPTPFIIHPVLRGLRRIKRTFVKSAD